MPTMGDFLFQHQFHQFFCGRRHILEALSERNNCEAHAFQVLNHLHSTPTVKGDLPNIETITQALDELLDVAVVNDINEPLRIVIVRDMWLTGFDAPPLFAHNVCR